MRDVKLSCASGEVLALIGESGSGKTTIAHALLGLLPGSAKIAGTAVANGVEILRAPARVRRELLRKSIGYIPQDASACFSPYVCLGKQLWRFWTVRTSRNDRARFHDRATTCLRSVHLDPEVMKRYPQQLSLGQIQRAAIANAIMTEPELLIAEEPTSALDAVTGAGVLALLGRAALRGMSVLLVTHDLGAPPAPCSQRCGSSFRHHRREGASQHNHHGAFSSLHAQSPGCRGLGSISWRPFSEIL